MYMKPQSTVVSNGERWFEINLQAMLLLQILRLLLSSYALKVQVLSYQLSSLDSASPVITLSFAPGNMPTDFGKSHKLLTKIAFFIFVSVLFVNTCSR